MRNLLEIPDIAAKWAARLARVRQSQARTDTTGMTRPPRDPDEREFLSARGGLGPFREVTELPGQTRERPPRSP
jgi:hypothetical protein